MSESKAGPSFGASVAIIAIGLLIAIPSAIKVLVPLVGVVSDVTTARPVATPGERRLNLKSGDYTIFERTGTRHGFGGVNVSNNGAVTLRAEDAIVTGPDGAPVYTHTLEPTGTATRGANVYTSAIGFHAMRSGAYDIRITQPGSGEAVVGRTTFEGLRRAGKWLVFGLVSIPILLLGFILLIVGSVRRGRTQNDPVPAYAGPWTAPPAAATPVTQTAPPADWYPDPEGVSRLRYWDGTQWTEHRA